MQTCVNLVDLVKSCLSPCPYFPIFFSNKIAIQTSIYLQNLASRQPRTPPVPSVFEDSPVYQPGSQPRTSPPTFDNRWQFCHMFPKLSSKVFEAFALPGQVRRRRPLPVRSRVAGAPWDRRGPRPALSEPRTAPRGLRLDSAPTRLRGCKGGWKDSNV